jgi:hypothetical protein
MELANSPALERAMAYDDTASDPEPCATISEWHHVKHHRGVGLDEILIKRSRALVLGQLIGLLGVRCSEDVSCAQSNG